MDVLLASEYGAAGGQATHCPDVALPKDPGGHGLASASDVDNGGQKDPDTLQGPVQELLVAPNCDP